MNGQERLAQVEAASLLRTFTVETDTKLRCQGLLQGAIARQLVQARAEERLACAHELEELGFAAQASAVRERWAERLYP